jgi:hypothetical protein
MMFDQNYIKKFSNRKEAKEIRKVRKENDAGIKDRMTLSDI